MLIRISLCLLLTTTAVSASCPDDQVDTLFADYAKPRAPGASAVVVHQGQVIYRKAFGLADREADRPASSSTNYRLASVSKQFTATAILILIDRGAVALEDPLTRFFPGFPAYGRRITVRHLLNHTSGLKDYEDLIPAGQTEQLKDKDVLALLSKQSSGNFTPGARYSYSNSGYVLLGLIVEAASGKSFAEFLAREIFAPLKMTGTVAFENGISHVGERAYGYSPSGSGFRRTDQSVTSATLGDGGIYTSVDDFPRWEQAVEQSSLVTPSLFALAFTPGKLNDGSSTGYGFGWMLDKYRGRRRQHHTGSTIGFRTASARFPDDGFFVAVLVNRANASPWTLAERITDLCLLR